MARLLQRLGLFSSRHPWAVIAGWVVALAVAVGGFAVGHGTLTTAVELPGTETQKVADKLAAEFPAASGGSGTVVFGSGSDEPFTDAQKTAISAALKTVTDVPDVKGVTDPFESQQQLEGAAAQMAQGQQQIEQAQAQIDAGRAPLEQGKTQVDAAKKQLDDGQAQLDAAKAAAGPAAAAEPYASQFAQQQAQIDQGRAQLEPQLQQVEAGLKQLEDGQAELDAQKAQLADGAELAGYASGLRLVSEDGTSALAMISFDKATTDIPAANKTALQDKLSSADLQGATIDFSADVSSSMPKIFGIGEAAGVLIAALVLIVMLGTLVAAGLPLLSALVGVGVGVAGCMALSGVVKMLSVTPILGLMLGLAVGIDYSLFILNRHRKQLLRGMPVHESIGLANGTSGNAVVFAGTTVIIALLALNVTGIGFLGLMGTVGAVCVLVAILVAVTFTPAVLGLAGLRVLPKRVREEVGEKPRARVLPKEMSGVRAWGTLVACLALLIVVALPATSMRLGLPVGSSEPAGTTQYRAFETVSSKFGEGVNGPLLVVAEYDAPVADEAMVADQLAVAKAISAAGDVAAIAPIGKSDSGTMLAFQVVPKSGPDSEATESLVHALRDLGTVGDGPSGTATLGVAGNASGQIDISQKLADVLPLYLALVVGLSFVILVVVFRSILVPLTATLGFVLSILAAFGAVTAVFQWGWGGALFGVHTPAPVLSFLPIVMIGVLFGLAMDYQLFLVSGMREARVHGSRARLAVREGLYAGRAVVIAAALIMTSVFAGFVFNDNAMIKSVGFGLAIGVLLDAFVVRLFLIPAVMHLLGESAWWLPKWLDRILPDVDVEGAKLERPSDSAPDTLSA